LSLIPAPWCTPINPSGRARLSKAGSPKQGGWGGGPRGFYQTGEGNGVGWPRGRRGWIVARQTIGKATFKFSVVLWWAGRVGVEKTFTLLERIWAKLS